MKSVRHARVNGKTVLLRVDFNVSLKNGRILNDQRIRETLPTIRWLLKKEAKIVIASHLGRPKGYNKALTLKPVAQYLARLLKRKIHFFPESIYGVYNAIEQLPQKSIILLENIRFYPGEEKNDPKFAQALAHIADIYVDDAFGAAHRKSASLVAITKYLPSYAGFLLQAELSALDKVRRVKMRPLVIILGGAKLEDKLPLIKKFLGKADAILTGGGVANTFLKAQGISIGKSLYEPRLLGEAKRLLRNKKVVVPIDWRIARGKILDVGPKTAKIYADHIKKARMVLWNGPLGLVAEKRFRAGSKAVALAIVRNRRAFSVVGGGDTVAFIEKIGLAKKISFVSTGGGAMLEYLAGKKLPAIEALKHGKKR